MDLSVVSAVAKAAQSLHAAARSHKRAEAAHRRQAAALMAEHANLVALCERHGIRIEIADNDRAPEGGVVDHG